LSGPVKLDALSSARLAAALLRVRCFSQWAAGTLALLSVAVPPARALHRAAGRLTVSGKGSVFGAGRAADIAARAPRLQPESDSSNAQRRSAEGIEFCG